MKKILFFLFFILMSIGMFSANVTYNVTSTSAVSTSGAAPTSSSVTYSQTYNTKCQLTSGNSAILTITNLGGVNISNFTLSMKSNTSNGSGKLKYSVDGGNTWMYLVGSSNSGVAFNNSGWNGSWSTSYVNISKSVSLNNITQLTIMIEATANSLYCQSYSIAYTSASYTITPKSNNESYGTVSLVGTTITATPNDGYRISTSTPYAVTSGTATVSQDRNDFTVSPSSNCTIQINFEAIPSHTINWYSNTELIHSQEDLEGETYTDPGTPTSADCNGTKVFVGWTTEENYDNATIAPNDLFSYSSTMEITENADYYAIFANAQENNISKTYSFTITPTDFNGTSYTANDNEKSTTAATDNSDATFSVTWESYDVMLQSSDMQFRKNSGCIYNTIDLGTINSINVTSTAGTYTTYYGNTEHPTSGTYATNKGFFTIKNTSSNAGYASNITITFTKVITDEIIYTNYTTQCCPSVHYPEVSTTTDIYSSKLIWNNQSSVKSYELSLTPNGTIQIVDTIAYLTNLSRSTNYTYNLKANGEDCYKITEGSFKTKSPNIDVVLWTDTSLSIDVEVELGDSIFIENKLEGGEEKTADLLFFSKYFEAAGSVKLLGIFNGTGHNINLSEYSLSIAQTSKDAAVFKHTKFKDIKKSGGEGLTSAELLLENNEELILISYTSSDNDIDIIECAKNNAKSGFDKYIKISTPELQFNGDDAIALMNPEGNFIDLIGAGTKDGGSNISSIDKTSSSGGTYNGFMDSPGGWYTTTGIDLEMDTVNYALSTNRCLLVRKNTITSGLNAVSLNTEDFVTLGTEWKGLQIPGATSGDGLGITNACHGFDMVGSYNYSEHYLIYNELVEKTDLSSLQQIDGIYKIDGLQLDTLACDELKMVLYDKDKTKIGTYVIQVPIMISSDMLTDDISQSSDTCKNCDIVILGGSNLTVGNAKNITRNVMVYPNAILTIPEGKTYDINSLTLRRDNDSVPYLSYKGILDIQNDFNIELRMDANNWYWTSLPFEFKPSMLKKSNGETPILDDEYYIEYYDGANRAHNQTKSFRYLTSDSTFKAGQGFAIHLGTDHIGKHIYTIPFKKDSLLHELNASKTILGLHAWQGGNVNDRGWNLIGNPYMNEIALDEKNIRTDTLKKVLENGQWNGHWELTGANDLRYIIIRNSNWTYNYQLIDDGYYIKPFTSFFIQLAGNNENEMGVSFIKANQKSNIVARKNISTYNDEIFLRIGVGNYKTGCFISDDYTDEYEIGYDLSPFENDNSVKLYQMINDYKLLYSAINDSIIEHGIKVYTPTGNLHLDDKTNVEDFDEIYALYNGDWIDLLHGQTQDVNGEFILFAKRKTQVDIPTNIDIIRDNNEVIKFMHNNNLYIKKNNHIYNILGGIVK